MSLCSAPSTIQCGCSVVYAHLYTRKRLVLAQDECRREVQDIVTRGSRFGLCREIRYGNLRPESPLSTEPRPPLRPTRPPKRSRLRPYFLGPEPPFCVSWIQFRAIRYPWERAKGATRCRSGNRRQGSSFAEYLSKVRVKARKRGYRRCKLLCATGAIGTWDEISLAAPSVEEVQGRNLNVVFKDEKCSSFYEFKSAALIIEDGIRILRRF